VVGRSPSLTSYAGRRLRVALRRSKIIQLFNEARFFICPNLSPLLCCSARRCSPAPQLVFYLPVAAAAAPAGGYMMPLIAENAAQSKLFPFFRQWEDLCPSLILLLCCSSLQFSPAPQLVVGLPAAAAAAPAGGYMAPTDAANAIKTAAAQTPGTAWGFFVYSVATDFSNSANGQPYSAQVRALLS